MGYMGLDSYLDSDTAADLAYVVHKKMAVELKKGLKRYGGSFNTDGPENVAMIFEAFVIPCIKYYQYSDELRDVAVQARDALKTKIEKCKKADWNNDEQNKQFHLSAYKRMVKALEKYINTNV